MNLFPAVVVGGPPHSGKSVLTYSLTRMLRQQGVNHYVLRACPDGEGDWSQEATPETVRNIRIKGDWSAAWVEAICRDIQRRHLPLLVDVGGKPTPGQERIFDQCTHAILLTKDAATHSEWRERIARHSLPLLADLTSDLHGKNVLEAISPFLRGTIAGLERHTAAGGRVFEALVERLATLFTADGVDHRRQHLASSPTELAIDLERLAITLEVAQPGAEIIWRPEHLPTVFDYLPAGAPLAIYGRAPNWLMAGLARLAYPAPFYSFDVRLGWSQATPLQPGSPTPDAPLQLQQRVAAEFLHLEGLLPSSYIDYSEQSEVAVPKAPPDLGMVLSGKLPLWLYSSLALTYADTSWLAVYQPQLGSAVVVYSRVEERKVGDVFSLEQRD
jgi:CRISPR-associated protein Csx3